MQRDKRKKEKKIQQTEDELADCKKECDSKKKEVDAAKEQISELQRTVASKDLLIDWLSGEVAAEGLKKKPKKPSIEAKPLDKMMTELKGYGYSLDEHPPVSGGHLLANKKRVCLIIEERFTRGLSQL